MSAMFRPMAIAVAFLSLYWLSFSFSFLRALIFTGKLQNALEFEFWLHLLEPIGHIYLSRCNWFINLLLLNVYCALHQFVIKHILMVWAIFVGIICHSHRPNTRTSSSVCTGDPLFCMPNHGKCSEFEDDLVSKFEICPGKNPRYSVMNKCS